MSQRLEIDLETERVQLDGLWVTRDELTARIQQMLAAGDYRISRLSEALEQLAQTMSGARTLTLKLTSEQHAKLEAAGQKLGKSAGAFARELLMQVLGGQAAAAPAPVAVATPVATPPVIAAPAPVALPAPVAAPVVASSEVTPEEAAQALTITPKRREPVAAAPAPVPPVMTPVAAPVAGTPSAGTPSVVVDLGPGQDDPNKPRTGADGRRWFNRT